MKQRTYEHNGVPIFVCEPCLVIHSFRGIIDCIEVGFSGISKMLKNSQFEFNGYTHATRTPTVKTELQQVHRAQYRKTPVLSDCSILYFPDSFVVTNTEFITP